VLSPRKVLSIRLRWDLFLPFGGKQYIQVAKLARSFSFFEMSSEETTQCRVPFLA
jgi:hypothetical protein